MLELDLPGDGGPRFLRSRVLREQRFERTRPARPASLVWFATDDADLVAERDGTRWRLLRLERGGGLAAGETVVAVGDRPDALGASVGASPAAIASFTGRRRTVSLGARDSGHAVTLRVLEGTVRDVTRALPVCRVTLDGAPDRVGALARALVARAGAVPALRPLAHVLAADDEPPAGAPTDADLPLDDALAGILGTLAATMLHWAPLAAAGDGPHPVHQMRVALRRFRSALLVFRRPLGGSLDRHRDGLRSLAAVLGAARDWDVFLADTACGIARAVGDEARLARLLADAAVARDNAYVALRAHLASAPVRLLLGELALLSATRPWHGPGDADGAGANSLDVIGEDAATDDADVPAAAVRPVDRASARRQQLGAPLAVLAPALLDRRFKRLVRGRRALDGLPAARLHDARKDAKKLRYALEFLGPAFPRGDTRRLLRRLTRTQEALGAINDTATGQNLMAELTRGGRHDHAAGIVVGWLAAQAEWRRADLGAFWTELREQDRFWRH